MSEAEEVFRAYSNALTNWQRCQWARAGYPGLREKDPTKVIPFWHLQRGGT